MRLNKAVTAALAATFLVGGCAIIPAKPGAQSASVEDDTNCVFKRSVVTDEARCSLDFWIDYWSKINNLPWVKRQGLIAELASSPDALLQKVILSQPVSTPYRARLRAQHWLEQVMPSLTKANQARFTAAIAEPSNHILEYESALSLLSRSNRELSDTLSVQKQKIEELSAQLDALLNIESNLMSQKEETEQ